MSNEVLNVIKKRRSIRTYKADAIPEEILNAVLEAGTFAPTGGGKQSPIIVAITSPQYRKKIAELNAEVMGAERVGAIALGYPASSDVKAAERKEDYIVRI